MKLETCTTSDLDVYSNPHHLRRDIHTFVQYVRQREVKRTTRENRLPKADARRLAKLMSHPDSVSDIHTKGQSWWLDKIDELAQKLGFVSYDIEGHYLGYTSHSPSFPDNYMIYEAKTYDAFLALPLYEQEKRLFELMVHDEKHNEFYARHLHSSLKPFNYWGSALGVMPLLDFVKIRLFLFEFLAKLEADHWYSTASLIQYLQDNHPYFIIPPQEQLPKKDRWDRPIKMTRYGNFYEYNKGNPWGNRQSLEDDAVNGFARVEGRYIERFLEGIPLTLGYVSVAYDPHPYEGKWPEMGTLKAFRVHNHFQQLYQEQILTPKITLLPNFEIHIESPIYPISILQELDAFTTLMTHDKVIILKLEKTGVKAALATNPHLDVITLLKELTGHPLPQNVAIELEEWAGQSDIFTLYTDLTIFEGDTDLPELKQFVATTITPQLCLIRQPNKAFKALEEAERVPLLIEHDERHFTPLPQPTHTRFPKQKKKAKTKAKRAKKAPIQLQRETHITLHIPTQTFYDQLRKALLAERCLIEANNTRQTITYSQTYQAQVEAVLKVLGKQYTIKIEDKAV